MRLHVTIDGINELLDRPCSIEPRQLVILQKLECIERKLDKIMNEQENLQAAFALMDTKTTEQGVALAAMGTDLQEISDDQDRILAEIAKGGVTPELVAKAQALSDRVAANSTVLDAHAAFSKALAAKVENPVPLPVPEPAPDLPVVPPAG